MPKHGKYKKVRNQPSVVPMLNATTSAKSVRCDNSRSASDPQEANGLTSKKRRRETGDSVGSSPQDGSYRLKKEKKKAKTKDNNKVAEEVHEGTETSLSEEMQQLEKWIRDNITNHNQDTMKTLIQEDYEGNAKTNTGYY